MPPLLLIALLQIATPPRVEVRGVEVSGVWVGLAARSHVAVYLRGPEGIRLLSPDSSATWSAIDSGSAAIELPTLPSAAMNPVNCIITDRDTRRWDVGAKTATPVRPEDCVQAVKRERYLIVFALDADFHPGNPREALDDRLEATNLLDAARAIGRKLAVPGWEAVVVRLK